MACQALVLAPAELAGENGQQGGGNDFFSLLREQEVALAASGSS